MKIDQEKCVGCRLCIPYCPAGAISFQGTTAQIDLDECVECGVCYRVGVCPTDSFYQQPLEWPRSVRAIYSDPLNIHKETGLAGRGTEEIKTNDVTGRFKPGYAGVAIEVGRPGVGARMRELEKMSVALTRAGVEFERKNPLTNLIDEESGRLPPEISDEKVLSAIIEISIPKERLLEVIELVEETGGTMDTVFSVDVASVRVNGEWEAEQLLSEAGIYYRPNAKVNVGLGKLSHR